MYVFNKVCVCAQDTHIFDIDNVKLHGCTNV